MIRRRSIAFDVTLAVLFAAVASVEAAFHLDNGYRGSAPPLLAGVVAAIGATPIAIRRIRPVLALGVQVALVCAPHLIISSDPVFVGGAVAFVVSAEAVGRYGVRGRSAWALLLLVPGLALLTIVVPGFAPDAAVSAALVASGWTFGVLVRALLERRAALRGELAALHETEVLLSDRAVTEERTRIARDLHDVIAHCVSVMVLQAGAARLRLELDPASSVEAIAQIERTGHEALLELQRVLGLLRADAHDDPAASLASLDRLVDEVEQAGLEVRLWIEGDPSALPAGLDRSLYRVVQECLTNALKHGGDPQVDLRLTLSGTRVELEVVNTSGAARTALPGGNGQIGMRERVTAFGGALSAGPDAGRWRVHAIVPVAEATA